MKQIRIFDTTLRDGEQAPGCSMTLAEKMLLLEQLKKLNVDIIEAGFPKASKGDFEAVRAIADRCQEDSDPIICGLARTDDEDIDRCWEAIKRAAHPRIHTFIGTSDIHMKVKLRMDKEQVKSVVATAVSRACRYTKDVEFSCEDATRSDWDFLVEVYQIAINHGATTLNVPDTVGYTLPHIFGELIAYLRNALTDTDGFALSDSRSDENIIISVHGHDDIGHAVANFVSGCMNGARQVECTLLGIGERAGNGSLEEFVMALRTHREHLKIDTGICTQHLTSACKTLAGIINMDIMRNKPVVGSNAFAHEAGIHQAGVLRDKLTYEHMKAEDVGQISRLVLGKHSGRNAFRARVEEFGLYEILGDNDIEREDRIVFLTRRCKEWADRDKIVPNEVMLRIIASEIVGIEIPEDIKGEYEILHLIWTVKNNFIDPFGAFDYEIINSTKESCELVVKLEINGKWRSTTVQDSGNIGALFIGLKHLAQLPSAKIKHWDGKGDDGARQQGRIVCKISLNGHTVEVELYDHIVRGSGKAFVKAFNLLYLKQYIEDMTFGCAVNA